MIRLPEYFKFLTYVKGIKVFDSKHAWEEFQNHFPELSYKTFIDLITKGITKIVEDFHSSYGNYMVISKSTKVRLPIEIREDRINRKIIAVIPTTLGEKEIINLRKETEVFIEKKEYKRFPLIEGFTYFSQEGELKSDFEDIFID